MLPATMLTTQKVAVFQCPFLGLKAKEAEAKLNLGSETISEHKVYGIHCEFEKHPRNQ